MYAVDRRRFLQLSAGGAAAALLTTQASAYAQPTPGPTPATPSLLLGANLQGWATRGETTTQAQARLWPILRPQVVRDWPMSKTWTWADRVAKYPDPVSLIVEFTPSSVLNPTDDDLAQFRRVCQSAPTDRTHWVTIGHEIELRNYQTAGRPAEFKSGLRQYINIHRQYAPSTLRHAVVLMGSTYLSDRWTWGQSVPFHARDTAGGLDWLTGLDIDDIGADIYQQVMGASHPDQGTPDASSYILEPILAAAKVLNKGIIIPEFGTFCVDNYYRLNSSCVGIPDAARAQFIRSSLAFMRRHPRFKAVCTFEATQGGWANPCCLTPPPDWPGGKYSPLALAAWR